MTLELRHGTLYQISSYPEADAEAWINFLSAAKNSNEALYMIIDCAHDSRIYPALLKTLNTKCCLFTEEKISEMIKGVSPFLVKIKHMDEFVRWCIREGVKRHWMIFFTSMIQHVSDLKLNFKRFSIADGPDGTTYFFRFYDSRVLPKFLLTSEREREIFFRYCLNIWVPAVMSDGTVKRLQIRAADCVELPI